MGRPSKLTDAQWEKIGKKLLAKEATLSQLARDYGVSKGVISQRFSKRLETVKNVANQIVATNQATELLNVSERFEAFSLANELMSISTHAASAGKLGMMTAHRLNAIANEHAQKIDDADPESTSGAMKTAMALSQVANEASKIGMNLLSANKGIAQGQSEQNERRTLADFYRRTNA